MAARSRRHRRKRETLIMGLLKLLSHRRKPKPVATRGHAAGCGAAPHAVDIAALKYQGLKGDNANSLHRLIFTAIKQLKVFDAN